MEPLSEIRDELRRRRRNYIVAAALVLVPAVFIAGGAFLLAPKKTLLLRATNTSEDLRITIYEQWSLDLNIFIDVHKRDGSRWRQVVSFESPDISWPEANYRVETCESTGLILVIQTPLPRRFHDEPPLEDPFWIFDPATTRHWYVAEGGRWTDVPEEVETAIASCAWNAF